MLVGQLKNYLSGIPDDKNVLIFTTKENEARQLLFGDIDKLPSGNIIIDAEYIVPAKETRIESDVKCHTKLP